jgi:uncharacterized protein (TIGR03382 family)
MGEPVLSFGRWARAALFSTLFAFPSLATTVTFQQGALPVPSYSGARDVWVDDGAETAWNPAVNYGGLDAWVLEGGAQKKVILVRWDVSSLAPGAVLTGVQLELRVLDRSNAFFNLYEALVPWSETTVTWNQSAPGTPWNTAGAQGIGTDRGSTLLGQIDGDSSGGTNTMSLNAAGVAVVQGWIDNPATNQGFLIENLSTTDAFSVHSAEATSSSDRPKITLLYNSGLSARSFQDGELPTPAYSGTRDASLGSGTDPADQNFRNTTLSVRGGASNQSALLSFDVSLIPAWATVTSVGLSLHVTDASSGTFQMFELLRPWTEAGATWNTFNGSTPWGAPGATGTSDRGGVAVGALTPTLPVLTGFALGAPFQALVQGWVSGAPNHGFVLGSSSTNTLVFWSSRHGTLASRPALTVDYLEGQLAFLDLPLTGVTGEASSPLFIERRNLEGVPLSAGLPALAVTVSTDSPQGELALDPMTAPWLTSLTVTIPAGSSKSEAFRFRDARVGITVLAAEGGASWLSAGSPVTLTSPSGSSPTPTVQDGNGTEPLSSRAGIARYAVGCSSTPDTSVFALAAATLGLAARRRRKSWRGAAPQRAHRCSWR